MRRPCICFLSSIKLIKKQSFLNKWLLYMISPIIKSLQMSHNINTKRSVYSMNLVYTSRWYIYLNECLHWPYPHSSQHIEMKHYQSPEKASEGIAERIKNKERSKKFHLVVVPPDDDVTSIALLTCKARWGPKKQFFLQKQLFLTKKKIVWLDVDRVISQQQCLSQIQSLVNNQFLNHSNGLDSIIAY